MKAWSVIFKMKLPQYPLRRPVGVALALVVIIMGWPSNAAAQGSAQGSSIGGHVGVALPLIWRAEEETTTMADEFIVSVPVGVIFRKNTALPIDLSVAPTLHADHTVSFSIGVNTVRGIGRGFAAAGGMLVDVSNPAWGFAAALDKLLLNMPGGKALVGDLIVPVMFNKNDAGARFTSFGVAMHVGFVF